MDAPLESQGRSQCSKDTPPRKSGKMPEYGQCPYKVREDAGVRAMSLESQGRCRSMGNVPTKIHEDPFGMGTSC